MVVVSVIFWYVHACATVVVTEAPFPSLATVAATSLILCLCVFWTVIGDMRNGDTRHRDTRARDANAGDSDGIGVGDAGQKAYGDEQTVDWKVPHLRERKS